jgi:hypothetical protein
MSSLGPVGLARFSRAGPALVPSYGYRRNHRSITGRMLDIACCLILAQAGARVYVPGSEELDEEPWVRGEVRDIMTSFMLL